MRDVAAGEFQCAAIDDVGRAVHVGPQSRRRARPARDASFEVAAGARAGLPAMRGVALGKGYMLALTQDRAVYAWGGNAAGQLGARPPAHRGRRPSRVAHRRIACTRSPPARATRSRVTSDGKVLAWGSNNHGQLGRDAPAYSTTPIAGRLAGARAGRRRGHVLLARARQQRARVRVGLEPPRPARRWAIATIAGAPARVAGLSQTCARSPPGRRTLPRSRAMRLYGWGINAAGQLGSAAKEQQRPHATCSRRREQRAMSDQTNERRHAPRFPASSASPSRPASSCRRCCTACGGGGDDVRAAEGNLRRAARTSSR